MVLALAEVDPELTVTISLVAHREDWSMGIRSF